MNQIQQIKIGLLPYVKGSPFIALVLVLAILLARNYIKKATPIYQSVAKIKLDDQAYGFSSNNLYSDLDIFSSENKIESEAQVLESPLLLKAVVNQINAGVRVFRQGAGKEELIYGVDSPLEIDFVSYKDKAPPNNIVVNASQNGIELVKGALTKSKYHYGDSIKLEDYMVVISIKEGYDNQMAVGSYRIELNSSESVVNKVLEHLHINAIDKEIPVLRIVYDDQNARRAQHIVNHLCEVYIEDYVKTKSSAAQNTLNFIDERLAEVTQKLVESEGVLEKYKIENKVVNTKQETETGLRSLANLKIQLINVQIQQESIDSLDEYMQSGDYFNQTSINFGYGDLLMTELVKKMKQYIDERHDLLLKYTVEDPKILAVDKKIQEIKNYIEEAIKTSKSDIKTKRLEMKSRISKEEQMFDGFPTREREMKVLEREFLLNEQVYTFLSQKRTEAAIASSALISFHRIIQPATLNSKPISPNKTLITFVSGLLGIILGIAFVFIKDSASGKIIYRTDIERKTDTSIIGVVRKKFRFNNLDVEVGNLASGILSKIDDEQPKIVAIASSIRGEGRSLVATRMAKHFTQLGYSTLYADFDSCNGLHGLNNSLEEEKLISTFKDIGPLEDHVIYTDSSLPDLIVVRGIRDEATQISGVKKFESLTTNLFKKYDVVVIDTPPTAISPEAIPMMKLASINLFIIRARYTKKHFAVNPDLIQQEHGIDNIHIILNSAHKASNFNGLYIGSGLSYEAQGANFIKRIKNYLWYYIR
jgi:uncharacterized protein involved in exopolysaccharide biosynthesis/cellulose biosynthesis protein BcsQ